MTGLGKQRRAELNVHENITRKSTSLYTKRKLIGKNSNGKTEWGKQWNL